MQESSIFDLFGPIFDDSQIAASAGTVYSLYFLGGGPGGAKPFLVQCRLGDERAELRVATTSGTLGKPQTWRLGREFRSTLSAPQEAELKVLADQFVWQVEKGSYGDLEGQYSDGLMVAAEVREGDKVTRVVRDEKSDGSFLSPFERHLFSLAAAAAPFDGGIQGIRLPAPIQGAHE